MNFIRKRDYRRKKEEVENTFTLANKTQSQSIAKERIRLARWFKKLGEHESYSKEWMLQVLEEITMQCAGKMPVMQQTVDRKNDELIQTITQIYSPAHVLKALKIGAEIQGMIGPASTNINFNKLENDKENLPRSVEITMDEDRTKKVYEILNRYQTEEDPNVIEIKAEVA